MLIGVPMPLLLCFVLDYGFKGLLMGYAISGIVNAIGCVITSFSVDWHQEITNAKNRNAILDDSN